MMEEYLTVSRTFNSNRHGTSKGRALRWIQLCVTGFVCVAMVAVMLCDWHPLVLPAYPINERSHPPSMNSTHIDGKPMEKVIVNYTDNMFFTVKTSVKNYRKRLSLLMLTWFQVVDKNKVISSN